jgi:hypothetical protein
MAAPAAVLAIVRVARPQFRQRADALSFALHAALLAEGFVLVAAGAAAEAEPAAGAPLPEAGHDGWNASPDEYAFRYRQEGAASSTVALKALAASGKLFVDAAGTAPAAAAHLELRRVPRRRACRGRARPRLTSVPRARSVDDYTTGKLGDGYAEVYSNLEGLLARVRAALLPALKPEATPRAEAAAAPAQRAREPEPAYDGGYGGGARCAPAAAGLLGARRVRAVLTLGLGAAAGRLSARLASSAAWATKTASRPACRSYRRWAPWCHQGVVAGACSSVLTTRPSSRAAARPATRRSCRLACRPARASIHMVRRRQRLCMCAPCVLLTRRFLRRPAGHARLRARALRHRPRQRRAADAGAAAGAPRHRAAGWRRR